MTLTIRLLCGPSQHWSCLKDGTMRRSKKVPRAPVWRLLAASEDDMRLRYRAWRGKPTVSELLKSLRDLVTEARGRADSIRLIVPQQLSRAFPALDAELFRLGVDVARPVSQADAGVHFAKRFENLLEELEFAMAEIRERNVTPLELSAGYGPSLPSVGLYSAGPAAHVDMDFAEQVAKLIRKMRRLRAKSEIAQSTLAKLVS